MVAVISLSCPSLAYHFIGILNIWSYFPRDSTNYISLDGRSHMFRATCIRNASSLVGDTTHRLILRPQSIHSKP